jgi:D-alanyl-D-alanine carboxypeptidase-like protein
MRRSALLLVLTAALFTSGCAAGAPVRQPASSAPAPAASLGGAEPAAAVRATPRFYGVVLRIGPKTRARMARSWRPGCPVGLGDLRLLVVDYWGYDNREHTGGELVVHRAYARRILRVLHKLHRARFPIQRMRLVDAYGADDDRSMAANNTSGFNCRFVAGTRRWSEHALGRAIDLNPLVNPYVTRSGRVSPPAGRPYASRARRARGMVREGDVVVRAFTAAGWRWGGRWARSKDYQHFSATGR